MAAVLAAAVFVDGAFAPLAFARQSDGMWSERRRAAAPDQTQLASLPAALEAPLAVPSSLRSPSVKIAPSAPASLSRVINALPASAGDVRALVASGAGRRVVVHIQDIHANGEAQENIRAAVASLIDRGGAALVGLEGAFAPIDLSRLRSYRRPETTRRIADYLLERHKISGAVRAGLSAKAAARFVGIDDDALHAENRAAYVSAAPRAAELAARVAEARARLDAAKASAFTGELARFDEAVTAYRDGKTPISDYLAKISKFTDGLSPRLQTFAAAAELEDRIDFDRVEEERTRVLTKLVSALSPGALRELLARGTAYRAGALRHAEFYSYLRSLCAAHGVDLARFPAMDDYVRYVLLSDSVDASKLLADVEALEEEVYARLISSPEERSLVETALRLHLTGRLLSFSLTNDEWRRYRTLSTGGDLSKDDLAGFEAFYQAADKRDAAMADRFLAALDESKADAAVLVTGGFHARGIEERLAARGLQVLSFVPALTKVDEENGSAYLSVFARERAPLDRLFQGPKLFLSPPPADIQPAAVLGAAIDHADGPQRVADEIEPAANLEVSLVSAETSAGETVAVVDAENEATGEATRVSVRFDDERVIDVQDAPANAGRRWLSSLRGRFALSLDLRMRLAFAAGFVRDGFATLVSGFQSPRRAVLSMMAGLLLFNSVASSLPPAAAQLQPQPPAARRSVASPAPAVRAPQAAATQVRAPPARRQVAPAAKRAENDTRPARAAAQRRQDLRQAKQQLQAARRDRDEKIGRADRAIARIRGEIDRLTTSISKREKARADAEAELGRLNRQLDATRERLAAPAFKTKLPGSEVQKVAGAMAAADFAGLASDVRAMRNTAAASNAPGTERGGAIDARFDKAENILAALAANSDDLTALADRLKAVPDISPEEGEALAEKLNAIKGVLAEAGDVPVVIREAEDAALGLNAVPEADAAEFKARAARVAKATEGDALEPVEKAVSELSAALVNLESLRAEEAALALRVRELETQAVRVQARISSLQGERYYDIDGDALADELAKVASGRKLEDLAAEARFRLEALNPAGGTWGHSLQLIADALDILAEAERQLRDPTLLPEEKVRALNAAAQAVITIRGATPAFNITANPEFAAEQKRLPTDPDLLSEGGRRSFAAFRARLNAESPLYRQMPDADALALWYGTFIRQDVGAGFASVNLERTLVTAEAALRNGLNLRSRAEGAENAAEREAARSQTAKDEAARLAREADALAALRRQIGEEAERAARLAPNVRSIGEDFRPAKERMDALAKAADALGARNLQFLGQDGAALQSLIIQVRQDSRRLADGTVTDAEAAAARERVARLIESIDDFVNPSVVRYGERDLEAITGFMRELVNTGVLWLAGVTDERIKAGVAGEDTYEDRLMRAAVAIYGAPTEALGARRNLDQLKKNARWGIYDLLEGVNVFMGLLSLQQNFGTVMGKKSPVAFRIERFPRHWEGPVYDEKSVVPGVKGPMLLLAGANALVNAKGAVTELSIALTGEKPERAVPYFAATLFPEAFNRATWEIVDPSQKDEEGYVYYRTAGFALRTKIGRKENQMKWQPVADRTAAVNRLYRVRGGVVEVMAAGKDSLDVESRVKRLVNAAQAINQVIAFSGGLSTKIVSSAPTALARVNAAMMVIGTVSGLIELIDKAKFKSTLRSTYGGWVTSPDPNFSARMTLVYPDGVRVEMGALRENGALLVRRANVWEAPDGTPVYRTGTGRLKIALNFLRLRLRIWKSAERFQESVREGEKSAGLATSEQGVFVRRRSDSAPVRVVAADGKLFLETKVFGRDERYLLGEAAENVPVDGRTVTARPYYLVTPSGEPGALLGVVIGDAGLRPGETVSYQAIFTYLGSLPEKLNSLLVQMGVDEWYDLNPLESRFVNPGVPAYPGAGWLTDIDGVQRFMGANAAGETTTLYIRWTDDEGVFVLDVDKQVLYRYTTDASGRLVLSGVKGVSLPALAQTRERQTAESQWVRESSSQRSPRPTDIELRGLPAGVRAWVSGDGSVFAAVPANTTIEGVRFALGGTYRFRLGGVGVARAEEAVSHPFYRRSPLPLTPALPDIFNAANATKNVRARADGTTETWYAVGRLYVDARTGQQREVDEVWVEYNENGRRRIDRVTSSAPGFLYDAAVQDQPRPWARRLVHPDGLSWIEAPVPPSIRPHVPAGLARSEFARDASGRIYFRLTMADGRVFAFEAGASPAQLRADAAAIRGRAVDARSPLPDGIPDALVSQLPAAASGELVNEGGRWYVRLPSVGSAEERLNDLTAGRYVRVRNRTLAQLTQEFAERGLALRPGGEAVPFGGVRVTPHLAMETGRVSPSAVIVVVAEAGEFVHPETPDAPPVRVERGDILILEAGIAATRERAARLSSPLPFLDRVFLSIGAVDRASGTPLVNRGRGRLPALFGAGAEGIMGTWHAREKTENGVTQTTELYFVAENGGVVTSNGVRTRVEPGTVWIVELTRAGAERYVSFNAGKTPGWTVRVGPAVRPEGGLPFSLPAADGTQIPGRLILPATDNEAPQFIVDLPAGRTAETADVLRGPTAVASGDVLVFQWPAGFQRRSIDALGAGDRLYLPSLAPRSAIAAGYDGTPAPRGSAERRLIRGRAPAGLLPGLPDGVVLDVWVDPNHDDAPVVVEVVSAPDGAVWNHPQLEIAVPLSAGTTFVRVATTQELARERDRLATAERGFLAETMWDLDSTLLNARRQFNGRTDEAARRRRANNQATPWSFETRVGGLRATVIEDIGNPNSAYLNPALDLVVFHEAGIVNGVPVRPGVVYRRRSSLPVAAAQRRRLNRWGVGYPATGAGSDADPLVFDGPVLTGRRYLHATRPFTRDGRPNLVNSGTPERAVDVVRRNGVVYVVEGRPPSDAAGAVVYNLRNGAGAEVTTRGFDNPNFGGLTLVGDLDKTKRAALEARARALTGGIFDLDPRMMVRVDRAGNPEAIVVLGLRAQEFVDARMSGLGMIQMRPGTRRARLYTYDRASGRTVLGPRRALSGWVAIGDGPGMISIEDAQVNARPRNGKDGSQGWILVDAEGNTLGLINFGAAAPSAPLFGLATVTDLNERRSTAVEGKRFDIPDFSGLRRYDALTPEQQGRVRDGMLGTALGQRAPPGGLLVRLDPSGRPVAVVTLRPEAEKWAAQQRREYGYIQMDAGVGPVELEQVPGRRAYDGWIGIGQGRGQLTPRQVTENLVFANGVDNSDGLVLVDKNGRRIGILVEGRRRLPNRQPFLAPTTPQAPRSGVYTRPQPLSPAFEARLRPVVQVIETETDARGRRIEKRSWVWAAYIGGAWRRFEPVPGRPGVWIASPASAALRVAGNPKADSHPRGVVDENGRVTAIVGNERQRPAQRQVSATPGPWKVQQIEFRQSDNSSQVQMRNDRTGEVVIDAYFGRFPSSRTTMSVDDRGRPTPIARLLYRREGNRVVPEKKEDFDPVRGEWIHREDYLLLQNQTFAYPRNSPGRGERVRGEVLIAYAPGTRPQRPASRPDLTGPSRELSRTFYAQDDGRLIYTQVEYEITVTFYGPDGRPTRQWRYDLNPAIERFEGGRRVPNASGADDLDRTVPHAQMNVIDPVLVAGNPPPAAPLVVADPAAPADPSAGSAAPRPNPVASLVSIIRVFFDRSGLAALSLSFTTSVFFAAMLGLVSIRAGRGGGNDQGGRRDGGEDDLARRLVSALRVLSDVRGSDATDEQRAAALEAIVAVFEGAPLDQNLDSVDGRVDAVLGAFQGEGIDAVAFRSAFRREMETQFGRDVALDEAFTLAHRLSLDGAAVQPIGEVASQDLGTTGAAIVIVTEAMRSRLPAMIAAAPRGRDGRRVLFVAETESLRAAIEAAAAAARPDIVAVDGSLAFVGGEADRRLQLAGLESVLSGALPADFFNSVSNLLVVSPQGLPIEAEFEGDEASVLRDLLRQAVFVLINEQLEAVSLTHGTLESIGELARLISTQA